MSTHTNLSIKWTSSNISIHSPHPHWRKCVRNCRVSINFPPSPHTLPRTQTYTQSEFVDTYSAYLNEFKVAMQTLAKYEHESLDFRQLLLKCQHSVDCIGLSLSSYLLTPVQRLPRYELLLKVWEDIFPMNK